MCMVTRKTMSNCGRGCPLPLRRPTARIWAFLLRPMVILSPAFFLCFLSFCLANLFIFLCVDFVMDRRSIMAIAKAKAAEELAAKVVEAARRAAAEGGRAAAGGAPKPAQSKKKRPPTDGQKKLTEAGLNLAKKTKRAPSPSLADEVGVLTVPNVDDGGSGSAAAVVDLTAAPSSAVAQPLPLGQETQTKRAGKEIATATYQKVVEYPVGGGVFDDAVDGHDVLAQAMPAKDRAYLKRLGDVKVYEGGMDLIVQGAFMLMESHKRKEREIARLKELEQKSASADEAMACLDRLREDAKALQKRADEAAAARDDALAKLAESQRALEVERRKNDEVMKAKIEAEAAAVKAADEAVQKFLAEGWKVDEQLPWCYEVVAAKLKDWGMNSPAGQEYFGREMSVYYNMGQERMQRLLCRRLARALKAMNYTSGWARRNLRLPRLMKDPEEQANLPLPEREAPIESSGPGEPDYDEFDFLDDATSSAAAAGQETEAEEEAEDAGDQTQAGHDGGAQET
ncbi:unnamed protein product [Cuscuta europaea]|uniref:Uncharacterized protein n=2 Tax=Cuscuta europaea TaxID=41803 RepID=A0A9P0ZDG8_CUSEU|nr:unnamed protein product [Cuscuta europaea]